MRKIISSLFLKSKKSGKHRKYIILSVVALVEVLALIVISTVAWVETVSSIKIYTTNNTLDAQGNLITNGTKGITENHLSQKVSVSDSGDAIDLRGFFRPSGGAHLSPASSADGENFFFPETNINNHSTTNYRIATINDKNVNYISFTIKVTSANTFAFDSVPVIKVNNSVVSNNLVRFSIGYAASSSSSAATDFKIYGMQADETESVVSSADGSTSSTTVRAFSNYVKGTNAVITTAVNSYLTINMWIQDDASFGSASSYNTYNVEVSNFKLVPVYAFTVKAATNETLGDEGGSVAINNGDFGATATAYCAKGQTVTIKASPNLTSAFQFSGWSTAYNGSIMSGYSAANCTLSDSVYSKSYTISDTATLYAKFSDRHDLYFKPEFKHPDISNTDSNGTYAAYLWQWNPATQTVDKEWHYMSYVDDSGTWNGYYKCSYQGTATNVIFCYLNPNYSYTDDMLNSAENAFDSYRYCQTYDLVFPPELGEYAYRATSRYTESTSGTPAFATSYVMGYWEDNYSKVTATAGSNGSVNAYLAKSTTSQTSITRYKSGNYFVNLDGRKYDGNVNGTSYNKEVTLVATPNDKYDFEGWYDNNTLISTLNPYTVEAPGNPVRGSGESYNNKTYQARFKLKPDEFYLTADFNNWAQSGSTWKMSGPSNNEYTKSTYLDPDDYEFKIYERISETHYSNGWSYHNTYLGASDGDLLSSSTQANMKLNVPVRAEYTFHFNSSTKRFWITVANRVKCYIKGGSSNDNWPDSIEMTYEAENNYYYGSKQVNGNYYFKIYFNSEYYGNGYDYHDGYLGGDGVTLTTSGGNMKLNGSNKTYFFHFDPSTKKFWMTKR